MSETRGLSRRRGGRHRGKTGGLLRPDVRRLSAAVPVSSPTEDDPGLDGIFERSGDAAFPRWANGILLPFRRRADHLRCAGEGLVRATELKADCRS